MKLRSKSRFLRNAVVAFTLVEVLVALGVFAMLTTLFLALTNEAQQTWVHGDQKVEAYQNGRAILDLMSRDLSPAIASNTYQFVQTPNLAVVVTGTPSNPAVATNAPSLFWMAPSVSSTAGNICEIGYYLTRKPRTATTSGSYCLNRFFVAPDDTNGYYLATSPSRVTGTTAQFISPSTSASRAVMQKAFNITSGSSAVCTVAEGVVALWIRCFDNADNPIPWLNTNSLYPSTAPVQFNSAASFQMALADAPFSPANSSVSGTSTFQYSAPGSTSAANRLPASVEITIIVVDSRALGRNPVIPDMPPPPSDPKDIPAQIDQFNADLVRAGVKSARTLTTRVKMMNACP